MLEKEIQEQDYEMGKQKPLSFLQKARRTGQQPDSPGTDLFSN